MTERKGPLKGDRKQSSQKNKKKGIKKLNKTKVALLAVALLILITAGVFFSYGATYISRAPEMDPVMLDTLLTSYLYDHQDNVVTPLHGEQNRITVSLSDIPEHVQQAFIAIEDERFYSHFGFDMIGFARAILVNLRDRSFSQGASTITQQLVQDAFLTKDQTIERKVQEIWLAVKFEQEYSKEEIFEFYLNRMYFGQSAYGIEAAAQTFLDKSVGELDIAESALLAGMLQLPEYYNPYYHEERAINRMNMVLGNMLRLEYITEEEYEESVQTEFDFGSPPHQAAFEYPYFVDHVVHNELNRILRNIYDCDSSEAYQMIYSGGLNVYTTLNTGYQKKVTEVLNRNDLYPETIYINRDKAKEAIANLPQGATSIPHSVRQGLLDEENGIPQPQSAFVLADPKTGAIWALGGGRDYEKGKNELLRYNSYRQPGSAIKPILTYGPAFEEGVLGTGTPLDDSPISRGNEWWPENYDGTFRGWVSTREALAQSFNVPAVRAYQMLGLETGAEYARRMGLTNFHPEDAQPSWTLGAKETTALNMAQAFAVLANEGIKVDLHTIRRIEDRDGRVIYEKIMTPEQILSPETTFMMTDILKEVVTRTTARQLQPGRPMAAKTGTTDDARDIYLAAYAPNVVATFWMGYDEKLLGRITHGWGYSTTITREILSEVFKTLPEEKFSSAPSGVEKVEVCYKSGMLPTDLCVEAGTVVTEYFLANHVPRFSCDKHIEIDICTVSNLRATEFCPKDDIETLIFFDRGDYTTTDDNWKRGPGRVPGDAEFMPPEDYCDMHAEALPEIDSFTGTVQGDQIILEWNFFAPNLEKFHLIRQVGENQPEEPLVLANYNRMYADTDVESGNVYSYTLYGVFINGSQTEHVNVTVDFEEEPETPENFTAEVEGKNIILSWDYDHHAANQFILKRGFDPEELTSLEDSLSGAIRSYNDNNLEPGTYFYELIAVNWIGMESVPAAISVTIPEEDQDPLTSGFLKTLLAAVTRYLSLAAFIKI